MGRKNRIYIRFCLTIVVLALILGSFYKYDSISASKVDNCENIERNIVLYDEVIKPYAGKPYVVINNNKTEFSKEEIMTSSYEKYGEFDEMGRCTSALACIGIDVLPTEPRESISHVYPTGWHTIKYDIIEGKYLYNRCHLIGYQLTGENANKYNLITGTRYMNVQGMLKFEEMVVDYIKETSNHVMYRVTPVFEGDNLVASGVIIEALSVEDNGEGICFYVYVYNVQPGIVIDYETGNSERDLMYTGIGTKITDIDNDIPSHGELFLIDSQDIISLQMDGNYILNTNTHKFHIITCPSVFDMAEKNKKVSTDSREQILMNGYIPCKRCRP